MPSQQDVVAALAGIMGPDGRTPLPQSGVLGGVVVREDRVFVSLEVQAVRAAEAEPMRAAVERAVSALPGVGKAFVTLTTPSKGEAGAAPRPAPTPAPTPAHDHGHHHGHDHGHSHAAAAPGPGPKAQAARTAQGVPGVRTIIAVASGKGGVGKSTTSANLALALRNLGQKVAVLDADIYGPSMPRLFGLKQKPEVIEGKTMRPLEAFGLKIMSIGFLVEEETPMIWRGPMVMSAITQMLREVAWGDVDIMVVDMPPGTGDAQLTMAQSVPLAGSVIVSTPQDLALIDARRGIAMFRRTEVPILGIVENMSTFVCPHCGTKTDIFSHGGAQHEAERLGVPYLGEVPLALPIRETSDAGRPIVVADPQGPHAQAYMGIAQRLMATLQGSRSRPAPRIVTE
ncbi:Mrp/NBP35 family ATP-binding protein [Lichenibacterium ramalinae]|uniref:Iron-sulfur cluster carrier protein n=1 Tax=Lichenibacterium ramalinae TaxID=2316527 RepID=A0A4Q2R9L5_9HYPH|nr:Mrp/NBP35 family ATP-binding protein [Lichenibacterium ramalinae]RYB02206.1 iron-sulfur cluster carrier protein ApbC [Lichenibacterium ramalinae]